MFRRVVLTIGAVLVVAGALLVIRFGVMETHYRASTGAVSCRAIGGVGVFAVNDTGKEQASRLVDACVGHARALTILGAVLAAIGVVAGSVVYRNPTLPEM